MTHRARDLGVPFGLLPPGPTASVHDVPGVGLGHTTLLRCSTNLTRRTGAASSGPG
jgi:D-aminopeptidase